MEQSGEHRILAEQSVVWQALNDPAVLARCIDGCQSMERREDGAYVAAVKAKVGPVKATFQANLILANLNPPESYVLHADIKGGGAGFGKGSANVFLDADGAATVLRYELNAKVGGKLAQVGARLINGATRKMADDFFSAFCKALNEPEQQQ